MCPVVASRRTVTRSNSQPLDSVPPPVPTAPVVAAEQAPKDVSPAFFNKLTRLRSMSRQQALNELLGVRWRVDAVVEGAAAAPGPVVAPEQAREAARAAETAEADELMAERAADAGGDREPEPVVDPEQAALSLLRAQLGARPVDS